MSETRGAPLLYDTLNALRYDEKAAPMENLLPAAALCWSDEVLRLNELSKFSPADRNIYHLLFSIRVQLWKGQALSAEHEAFWREALAMCPDWPLFKRLTSNTKLLERQGELEERVYRFADLQAGPPDSTKARRINANT